MYIQGVPLATEPSISLIELELLKCIYIYIHVHGDPLATEPSISLIELELLKWDTLCIYIYRCPTSYRTQHFFNNSNTNEDTATRFEQEYVRCV